jgi:hypothetical protein
MVVLPTPVAVAKPEELIVDIEALLDVHET